MTYKLDPAALEAAREALNGVIGWLAALDYPGVGTQMQRCQLVLDILSKPAPQAEGVSEAEVAEFLDTLLWVPWPSAKDGRFQRRALDRGSIEWVAAFVRRLTRPSIRRSK